MQACVGRSLGVGGWAGMTVQGQKNCRIRSPLPFKVQSWKRRQTSEGMPAAWEAAPSARPAVWQASSLPSVS